MPNRHTQPRLEGLEARVAPVGFYEGPAPLPIVLSLQGVAQGSAQIHSPVHAASAPANATINISAAGRVRPLGWTTMSGVLHVSGGHEWGTLALRSANSRLTLSVSGPAGSGPLAFRIVNGMGTDPGTTFDFVREVGTGTLNLALATGGGREPITINFHAR